MALRQESGALASGGGAAAAAAALRAQSLITNLSPLVSSKTFFSTVPVSDAEEESCKDKESRA